MKVFLLTCAMLQAASMGVGPQDISAIASTTPVTSRLDESHTLHEAARVFGKEPVNARIDRVWHAIPGLAGWRLDEQKSLDETTRIHDGKLHLVWGTVKPSVSLVDLRPEPIYRAPREERSVSLMVNVSWGEEYVPKMLDVLRDERVRATFFLDGAWVAKHPDAAKQIRAAGHEIGSHGSNHPDFKALSNAAIERQMVDTNRAIKHTLGIEPAFFAPPAGSYDMRTVEIAARHHMHTILWTADTLDWKRPKPEAIVDRVLRHVEPGSLILMHPTAPTVDALDELIEQLRHKDYAFKTVGQVVDEASVVKPPSSLK